MHTKNFDERLSDAFRELSNEGFVAEMDFKCCQNYAGFKLTNRVEKMIIEGTPKDYFKGSVFWHAQDQHDKDNKGEFYVSYGQMSSTKYGKIGLSNEDAGKRICEAFTEHKIVHEWDGDGHIRILIKVD